MNAMAAMAAQENQARTDRQVQEQRYRQDVQNWQNQVQPGYVSPPGWQCQGVFVGNKICNVCTGPVGSNVTCN
jgi:hypothetical protein